jgi:hypothetical protein
MQVISTLMLQLAELVLTLVLLQYSAKPGQAIQPFFCGKVFTERNWVKETVLGFVVLITLVLTTSILADKLVGSEVSFPSSILIPLMLRIKVALLHYNSFFFGRRGLKFVGSLWALAGCI